LPKCGQKNGCARHNGVLNSNADHHSGKTNRNGLQGICMQIHQPPLGTGKRPARTCVPSPWTDFEWVDSELIMQLGIHCPARLRARQHKVEKMIWTEVLGIASHITSVAEQDEASMNLLMSRSENRVTIARLVRSSDLGQVSGSHFHRWSRFTTDIGQIETSRIWIMTVIHVLRVSLLVSLSPHDCARTK